MMHAPLSPEDRQSKVAQQHYRWRQICQRVYKAMCWIGGTALIGIAIGIVVNVITMPTNTPWSTLLVISLVMTHLPLVVGLVAGSILLFAFFWRESREDPQEGNRGKWLRKLQETYQIQMKEACREEGRWRRLPLRLMNKPSAVNPDAVKDSFVEDEFIYDSDMSLMEVFFDSDTSLMEVHDELAKPLLVLGKDGAGKSTLLLEFALEYIKQALRKPNALKRLPLILPLASWDHEQLSLQEWICVQCQVSYELSIEKSQQFLQNGQILPLLDGLDEVDKSKWTACIQAINTYCQKKEVPMIVSSRTEEYASASASGKLDLLQAIEILPLETKQVEASFAVDGAHLKALWEVYQSNAHLQELARTPLIVNILRATYWDQPVEAHEFSDLKKAELQRHVLKKYVDHMLKLHNMRSLPKPFSPDQAKAWLSWLACQMQVRWPPIFSLELLEPDWLSLPYQPSYYSSRRWLGMLLWGLLIGLFLVQGSVTVRLFCGLLGMICYDKSFSRWTEKRSRAEEQTLEEVLQLTVRSFSGGF